MLFRVHDDGRGVGGGGVCARTMIVPIMPTDPSAKSQTAAAVRGSTSLTMNAAEIGQGTHVTRSDDVAEGVTKVALHSGIELGIRWPHTAARRC
jgi:hypothetical protein